MHSSKNIKLKYTNTNEIEVITTSLKMKISNGYDGISTKSLKLSMSYISSTYICNIMISTGTFPTRLKFSKNSTFILQNETMKLSYY
jgi:hypothetical protein